MIAEIISIGDELLIGQVVNTNASWMAEQLSLAGINVNQITAIADQKNAIKNALTASGRRSNIVFITGGLGPTKDDITKDTLCEYFDTRLAFNQEVYDHIIKLFHSRGLKITEQNRKQAEVPESCTSIRNSNGTAPGMWFEKSNVIYVSMPGVPFEMKAMMTDEIIPEITKKFNTDSIVHKTILTHGIGESWLAAKISDWESDLSQDIRLAYLPQPGIVRLRLTAKGEDKKLLSAKVNQEIENLKTIIPDLIFGYNTETMEEVVGTLLNQNSLSVATAESCTGGYIAHLLTSVPGSSNYYKGSVVAYSNEIKEDILGVANQTIVDYGAVSETVVKEMASSIRKKFNTDFAISISGVAGPDGGTEEKPVGATWIGLATPSGVVARFFQFGEHRGRNIRRSALTALNILRLEILKEQSL